MSKTFNVFKKMSEGLVTSNLCSILIIFLVTLKLESSLSKLIVNVKNQGGETYQEHFTSDIVTETVQLEISQPNGNLLVYFIDFKNDIQIVNVILLGEEEKRESIYQTFCFVTIFNKTDFIPIDAMVKLRQKNPWTLRSPERLVPRSNVTLNVLLDIRSSAWISPHISTICSDARDSTYSRQQDIEQLIGLRRQNNNFTTGIEAELEQQLNYNELFLLAVRPVVENIVDSCSGIRDREKSCKCNVDLCLGWYPCSLKYCKSPIKYTNGTEYNSYRCGIHTCKKCLHYDFTVSKKSVCIE